MLTALVEGGNPSIYGRINAVTSMSQQVADYDRATELKRGHGDCLKCQLICHLSISFEVSDTVEYPQCIG